MFPSTLNQLYANYNIFIGSLLAKFYSLKKQVEIQLFLEDIVDVLLLYISFQKTSLWVYKDTFAKKELANSIYDGKKVGYAT